MNVVRSGFDKFYDIIKPLVFRATNRDPQKAHELFTLFCKVLHAGSLEKLVLDNGNNSLKPPFELSNAAGFNKNGDFPPTVLRYLGFDRVVVGTVTYDQWDGNPRPTMRRYPKTDSMVNWMNLPGEGAAVVAKKLAAYGDHKIPLTINFRSTPGKQGDEVLRDLEGTLVAMRDLPSVDRFELNVSCPNPHRKGGGRDARKENLRMLDALLSVVEKNIRSHQEMYIKVSPDSTQADVADTVTIASQHRVSGMVIGNTTTKHDRKHIPVSPFVEGKQVGGASGAAVYADSLRVQKLYNEKRKEVKKEWKLIACGGINSLKKVGERLEHGAVGIQIFTPLVFSGPKFVRQLRAYEE